MKTIFQIVPFATPEYHETILLRDDILRKPLGLEFSPEDLALEYDSYHLVLYDEHLSVAACLVLKPLSEDVAKMRQVAVRQKYQGMGLGKRLVHLSEIMLVKKGFKKLELHARKNVVPFYEKLGYAVEGKEFKEVGIPHLKMTKPLTH